MRKDKFPTAKQTHPESQTDFIRRIAKRAVLWLITFALAVLGIGTFMTSWNAKHSYIFMGIAFLLLALMACPLLTDRTKELPQLRGYYRYKPVIVIALVVLCFVLRIL